MRFSDPPTSKVELPTNMEISGEIEKITKQDIISPKSDIMETQIASIDSNTTTSVTNTGCVESATKLYYKFTDEQWKSLNPNQKKKLRRNIRRDIQKSVTNS